MLLLCSKKINMLLNASIDMYSFMLFSFIKGSSKPSDDVEQCCREITESLRNTLSGKTVEIMYYCKGNLDSQ